jgi:hypothetical protein
MPVKTTVNLDEELLRLAHKAAADQGVTFRHVLEEALRAAVLQPKDPSGFKLRWDPVPGGLLPGVDLADRDSLYDLMEDRS